LAGSGILATLAVIVSLFLSHIYSYAAEKDLVLKVMDSDYPLQDELIGVIRLPLTGLDLGFSSGRQHTCLILHEKGKRGGGGSGTIHPADAAKLNLKISHQAEEIGKLQLKFKREQSQLEATMEEYSAVKSQGRDSPIFKNYPNADS
jgi:hypothetical protein